jgi:peptidoglycan/LPS O-acetylase OafA/YrhL
LSALFVAAVGYYALVLYPAISGNPDKPSAYSGLGAQAFIVTNVIMLAFVGVLHGVVAGRATAGKGGMIRTIALASYCIYLFHRPVWWGMCRAYEPASGPARLFYLAGIGTPIIYVLSSSIQRCYTTRIEVNAAGWIRRLAGAVAAR